MVAEDEIVTVPPLSVSNPFEEGVTFTVKNEPAF
jgi:hypothetical protein